MYGRDEDHFRAARAIAEENIALGLEPMANEMLRHAIGYARRQWPVFPLRPHEKRPATKHGLLDATTDLDRIERFWRKHPQHGIGIRTGVMFDVVDLDSVEACDAINGYAPDGDELIGPMALTGKGIHIYIQTTGVGNKAALLPHVDFRGLNGYVVAAPSIHPNGLPYTWTEKHGPDTLLRRAPDWLRTLLEPHDARTSCASSKGAECTRVHSGPPAKDAYGRAALERELGRLISTPQGQRNHQLNRSSFSLGTLVASGHLDGHEVAHALLNTALASGLDEREAISTIKSGLRSGQLHPRQVAS